MPDPPTAWTPVYERLAKNDGLTWRTLDDVTAAVKSFLDPVLAGARLRWQAQTWVWRDKLSS
ncbi:MAG: hypothetical protein ACI9EF_002233 [Pseudohongiellaceae bacterium]